MMDTLQSINLVDTILLKLGSVKTKMRLWLLVLFFCVQYRNYLALFSWCFPSVTITENDPQYLPLEKLLSTLEPWSSPVSAWRLLSLKFRATQSPHFVPQDGFFQIFKIKGYLYLINRAVRPVESIYQERTRSITFYNFQLKRTKELIEEVTEIPCFTGTVRHTAQWIKTTTLKPDSSRTYSTLGKRAEVYSDIERFLSDETRTRYLNMGKPYRTGFLFYGSPGTGKSSTVREVALRFRRRIYQINIHGVKPNEAELLFADLPAGCIIVLDDFDGSKLGLGGTVDLNSLLSLLDGPTSHEENIVIMTTGKLDGIPGALMRKGRIDRVYHFDFASPEECGEMFSKMYPELEESKQKDLRTAFESSLNGYECSPADLVAFLMMHSNAKDAVMAVNDWIYNRECEKAVTDKKEEEAVAENEKEAVAENKEEAVAESDQRKA